MNNQLTFVKAIAYEVREWAEGKVEPSSDLCGMCAIASAELYRRLKKHGIESEIHLYDDSESCTAHVFLVVDDHVVDVTATQFQELENERVVILPKKLAEAYDFYNTAKIFKEPVTLKKWQRKTQWPSDQMVLPA